VDSALSNLHSDLGFFASLAGEIDRGSKAGGFGGDVDVGVAAACCSLLDTAKV